MSKIQYTFGMRIGIDARLWNETGVGRYIRNLVGELQEIDKKSEYVLFVKKGTKKEDLELKAKNWKVVETNIHWHSLQEQIAFPKLLYKENLDLMHFPYFSLPIFYNKPFVVTIHDLIINHFPTGKASTLPYPLYRLKRIGYDVVLHHAVAKSKKIIVPLNSVKKDLMQTLQVPEKKIAVTYEGVTFSSLRAKAKQSFVGDRHGLRPRDDGYFLYVGNAYPHKNLDFLIKAYEEFRKTSKDEVQLILVGKDDFFYKRLREKVKAETVEGITFLHNVSDEELFELYANARAFVSASKMEGFGLPPLEAMSASCLLLLSDIPSFREVCVDSARYFNPYQEQSLVEAMKFVYNLSHTEKQKCITRGLQRIKEFSWEKMAEETIKVYESSISIR